MTAFQKAILIGLSITIVVFIVLVIFPLFLGIQKESQNFISQKGELAKLEKKIQNLKNFQIFGKEYLVNLEKIEKLFIPSSKPLEFIEFLEKEGENSNLDIEILPFALEKKDKSWPSMNFRLSLTGAFSDFLKFLERLESAPYLIDILNLNVVKGEEGPETKIILLIKVYTK